MKKKKTTTIVIVVLVVCALGFVASRYFNWPVDRTGTKGDIAKSARFSRKSVSVVNPDNMKELLSTDESFKNNMVTAFVVMQSRVKEFSNLVDMSVDVAGNNQSFDKVLADMKAVKPMLDNVSSSMNAAGSDLNAVLGGEERKNLAQNTNNATLAYATLQKQNNLADQFIQATDEYLKKANDAEDRLKLVRDQWLEYQLVTSALNNDTKAQKKLEEKGYLLTSEQAISTLKEIDPASRILLAESSVVNGLLLGESEGAGRGVQMRFGDLGGLLAEMDRGGVLAEMDKGGVLAEMDKGGVLAEMDRGGVLAEMDKGGVLAEMDKGGVLAEMDKGGLFAEIDLGGLLNFEGGTYLEESFGEAIKTLGQIEPGTRLNEISGPGLLHEIDLGTMFSEIEGGGFLNEIANGGLAR